MTIYIYMFLLIYFINYGATRFIILTKGLIYKEIGIKKSNQYLITLLYEYRH